MAGGRHATRLGDDFETDLVRAHAAYSAMGVAEIRKLPVPTAPAPGDWLAVLARVRRIGQQVYGRLRTLSARQGYDFCGVLGPNAGPRESPGQWWGRGVAMEAKRCSEEKPSLPIKAPDRDGKTRGFGVKLHQLKALAVEARDFGVISTIVWRNEDRRLVLPTRALVDCYETYEGGGRKSIPVCDFLEYEEAPFPDHGLVEDWLFTLRCDLHESGTQSILNSRVREYEMVSYSVDTAERKINTANESTAWHGQPTELLDRLAKEADNEQQFIEECKRVRPANEAVSVRDA